jgi:hypothetical protein
MPSSWSCNLELALIPLAFAPSMTLVALLSLFNRAVIAVWPPGLLSLSLFLVMGEHIIELQMFGVLGVRSPHTFIAGCLAIGGVEGSVVDICGECCGVVRIIGRAKFDLDSGVLSYS